MKQSIKLILFKGKTYSDGSHPIMLQHMCAGKTKRKVIHRCKLEDWDPKTSRLRSKVKNSSYVNHLLSDSFASAERQLFKILSGEINSTNIFEDRSEMTVADALQKELIRLKELNKPSRYLKMEGYIKQLDTLMGKQIDDVDVTWFNKVIDHLKQQGNGPATIIKKVKTIRSIIAANSEKDLSKDVKAIRMTVPKTVKQKLTSAEFSKLESLDLPEGTNLPVVRDIFVLQVYLRGIRIGDLLQAYPAQFENGRFVYQADKTSKEMSIRLLPKAQKIVDKYINKHQRLFPLYTWALDSKKSKFDNERLRLKEKEICTTIVNNNLKRLASLAGINKPLSSHIARHTFARMAIDKINNPMITMELLGHSSLAIHQGYLNDIRKDDVLDQAADDIFG